MSKHPTAYPADTRALIVGGSGGIGRAVGFALADAKIPVHIHGLRPERVEETVAGILEQGGSAEGTAQRIDGPEDIPALLRRVHEGGGSPSILVVAFGPIEYAGLSDSDVDLHRRMMELNYMVPVALVRACLSTMQSRGFGRIVVFGGSGTDRIKGFTTIPAYSAAKTALGSFVKSTAKTIAGEHKAARSGDSLRLGVTINAVCPDYVATEYLTAAQVERYSPSMPLRRLIDPDEVARLVLFLTRPEAASINGQLISVDQGKQR